MTDDRLHFNSKIDAWLLIVLVSLAGICLFGLAQFWNLMIGRLWFLGLILAVCAALPLWILLTTRYSLSDSALFIRSGPFKWQIPIAQISNLEKTRSPLSSPALSLDRLRVEYGDQSLMISPEPRQAFLQQLEHRRKTLA